MDKTFGLVPVTLVVCAFLLAAQPVSSQPSASASARDPGLRAGPPAAGGPLPGLTAKESDLLVHDMGPDLADGIAQGQSGGSEFRTAPLGGLGQRLFFLHDGRTSDLLAAIAAHQSGSARTNDASEANDVVRNFDNLQERQKQDLLNFLRSL